MDNKILKVAILQVIKRKREQKIRTKEAYEEIATLLKLSSEQLNRFYTYSNGKSFNKFETKVRAAVEGLRKESLLIRGGEKGVWALS